MVHVKKISKIYIYFFISLFGFIWAFYPGINIAFYSDDFMYRVYDVASSPYFYIVNKNPLHNYAYRPVEFILLWFTQAIAGNNTILQHCIQLVMHGITAFMIYYIVRQLKFSKLTAVLSSLYFLFSQSTVHAVLSNDTVSQQISTLFGYLSIYAIYKLLKSTSRDNYVRYFSLSLLFYTIAIFSKELAVGYLLFIVFLILMNSYKNKTIIYVFFVLFPFMLITMLYMFLRQSIGVSNGSIGSGGYDLHLGINNIVNFVIIIIQTAMPFSSADIFIHLKTKMLWQLIIPSIFTISVLIIPFYGFYKNKELKMLLILISMVVSVMGIAISMNHISELYVYQALPVFSFFFGYGISLILSNANNRKIKLLVYFWIFIIGIINVGACHSKADLMNRQGLKAQKMYCSLKEVLKNSEKNDNVILVNKSNETEYSIFYRSEFNTLQDGLYAIAFLNNRSDVKIKIISEKDLNNNDKNVNCYMLNNDYEIIQYPF